MSSELPNNSSVGIDTQAPVLTPPRVNEDFTSYSKLSDVGRWYITRHIEQLAQKLPAGTYLLDAGAGECAYKKYFTHCRYVSIDLAVGEDKWNYQNLDYIAPLDNMPFEDNTFDAVLCTQVLEHLEWPRECTREMCRVLKPGGKLYLTAPMAHMEHQTPYDFFRYTSYGLRSICEHAGFRKVEIIPFGGMYVRWAYELPRGMSIFPAVRRPDRKIRLSTLPLLPVRLLALILVKCTQALFLTLDRFDRSKIDPFGWALVAEK